MVFVSKIKIGFCYEVVIPFLFLKNDVDMGNKYDTVIDIETFILNKI